MMNAGFTELLLGLLALILLSSAVIDVRTFTISNGLNAASRCLRRSIGGLSACLCGPTRRSRSRSPPAVFVLLAVTFYMGMMGGGDVKLAAAIALWFKPCDTLSCS